MKLFFRKYGVGPPLIIIHGLYGSSDNWVSIGRKLSSVFEVYIIDQRNHGRSPHSEEHNYHVLKEDLKDFMDSHSIEKAILIGHSMGGKTAMFFAIDYPERVSHLIVADISPLSYSTLNSPQHHLHTIILDALSKVDFSTVTSREDVDIFLSAAIPQNSLRQFLLKNINRSKDNTFSWALNVNVIREQFNNIMLGLDESNVGITGFPVLFIKGENSDYISEHDIKAIELVFPYAEIETIPKAGHWLHAEQPELFLNIVREFILN